MTNTNACAINFYACLHDILMVVLLDIDHIEFSIGADTSPSEIEPPPFPSSYPAFAKKSLLTPLFWKIVDLKTQFFPFFSQYDFLQHAQIQ